MDSKLRKAVILLSTGLIAVLVLLVLWMNREDKSNKKNGTIMQQVTESQQAAEDDIKTQDLKAFLRDDSFFDQTKPNAFLDDYLKKSVELFITSVEKDMRIQVVDLENQPVSGQSFEVVVNNKDTYKDLDRDGIIYIGELSAGEYQVALNPMDGFRVPGNPTRVHVKEHVEYVAIQDISLLMKTEQEIDAAVEDTAVVEADADADKTEIQRLQKTTGTAKLGIDVSKWQGDIDWDKVKNAGIEYAIIRAGYRGSMTGVLVEDPYFEANMKGAISHELPVGVYFFTQATNEVEAVEEASMVIELLHSYKLSLPVFLDTEGAGGNGRADGLDADTRTLICEAFCKTIENAGYRAGIYASRNWLNNALNVSKLSRYVIWLAEYRSVPLYQGYYELWQYTSKGQVDGIDGNVDLSISYYDISQ